MCGVSFFFFKKNRGVIISSITTVILQGPDTSRLSENLMVRTGKNLRPSIAHPYLQDCIWRVRFLSAGVPVSPNLKGLLRVANIYQ
jgi:hypothetical protein